MRFLAGGDLALPAGIQWSDVLYITERVLGLALIVTLIGIAVLRQCAARSIKLMLTVVVAVAVICSLLGVAVIAYRMIGTAEERDEILDLMGIAGLAALVVALFLARRLTNASRAISYAVQGVGQTGVYIAPSPPLPAELAELSEGLTTAHERLAKARSRERALEASRRELVAWVSHDLRTPLAGLRAMAEALEDQVVINPREVSQYHTQIRREVERLTLMIDDLFELSRIHAGALRLSRRMVGLEDVVAEVVASAEPVARAKRVRLTGAAVRRPAPRLRRGLPRRVRPHTGPPGRRRPRPVHRPRHRRGSLRPDRRPQHRPRLPVPDPPPAGPPRRSDAEPHRPPGGRHRPPRHQRELIHARIFSAERIDDPDAVIFLPVVEVFGQDLRAAQRAGCLDDRGVPVRELEALAGVQGRHHDPVRDVLHREAPERLDEQNRLLMTDGVRAARARCLNIELLEDLH